MSYIELKETLQNPENGPIPLPIIKPAKVAASEFITIPVSEYMYLQRVDALMDVLLLDSAYSSAHTIQAVKDAVLAMRMAGKGECEE